jgi:hypothetical protein
MFNISPPGLNTNTTISDTVRRMHASEILHVLFWYTRAYTVVKDAACVFRGGEAPRPRGSCTYGYN